MESLAIYCNKSVEELHTKLIKFGVKGDNNKELFFGNENSNLYICLYSFEEEEDEIKNELSEIYPLLEFNSVTGIDIGRSEGSWLTSIKLVLSIADSLDSVMVIDDSLGEYWTIDEIKERKQKNGVEFLESYLKKEGVDDIWSNL